MSAKPSYFERVREGAERRWQQLEEDPELAGPWHQLFKQVQSPRHVLSELLQNADDAGATEASVNIEDGVFTFSHNGEDFTEEHFASLCRFGYSNKRALHTIGFRGIGFKSTFSLGDRVELYTPSLAVKFERARFTEPVWCDPRFHANGMTAVRVCGVDARRQLELEKNFDEWMKSSKSLLFFRHLRRIDIGGHSITWRKKRKGPVHDSEWVALVDQPNEEYLLIRSEPEAFPNDALDEIRQERLLGLDEDSDFPPCRVEIVMGGGGRLYVVLPTGVDTDLPFDCNAPFIQDPARLKIKDPETSPTNRWLLERCGNLAAAVMLAWLNNKKLSDADRAEAYELLPRVPSGGGALDESCTAIVADAFSTAIAGKDMLLTSDGDLVGAYQSVIVPKQLLEVWPTEQAMRLLDDEERPPLSSWVIRENRQKLVKWRLVEEVDRSAFLEVLKEKVIPKPETWAQLVTLWAFVAPSITGRQSHSVDADDLKLIPVQGKRTLYPAQSTIRLGEKRLLRSDEDWEFLAQYLLVLNPNWSRYLTEQKRDAREKEDQALETLVDSALDVLTVVGLEGTNDADEVVSVVAANIFNAKKLGTEDYVRFTQIVAALGASVGESFRYVTIDGRLRTCEDELLFDTDGRLEPLLPEDQKARLLIHSDYTKTFISCSKDDWTTWATSKRSRLHTFPPIRRIELNLEYASHLDRELARRGYRSAKDHAYSVGTYRIDDWDFPDSLWSHWESMEADVPALWSNIVERLLAESDAFWTRKTTARALRLNRRGRSSSATVEVNDLRANWIVRLADKPCLTDTRGFRHKPSELMRRTPETESLLDVEQFVHGRIDTEKNRAFLDLLGVQSAPTGPERLLDRLRALSLAEEPPVREVDKWYLRLDQMINNCSTEDAQHIKASFRSENLILTRDGAWVNSRAVFRTASDEDVPDAAVVRPSVCDLTLWTKIGVPDRPTVELAVKWLVSLPVGEQLPQNDLRRVRNLLARHPEVVMEECEHWLSLAGTWEPAERLRFALTMQSLAPWQHLYDAVKMQTADLLGLPAEVTSNPPFSSLLPLASVIEERFSCPPRTDLNVVARPWLTTFGAELRRVEFDSDGETERVRAIAERVEMTRWHDSATVEIIPYVDGTPAGTARRADTAWIEDILYVGRLPKAKLAKRVPEEIGKVFGRADIKAALDYSFERHPDDIREYLEENFTLVRVSELPAHEGTHDSPSSAALERMERSVADGARQIENVTDLADTNQDDNGSTEDDVVDDDRAVAGDPLIVGGVRRTTQRRTPKPTLMERIACEQGFEKINNTLFTRQDGHVITRALDSPFHWEHRDSDGGMIHSYWEREHCLESEPLELAAEVWTLLERFPDSHALILTTPSGGPIVARGEKLVAMRREKRITLYPAAYRLVYDGGMHHD